jgi:hypothetical protein
VLPEGAEPIAWGRLSPPAVICGILSATCPIGIVLEVTGRNGCAKGKLNAIVDVDIRRAEGAAQRIDATEINLCCRPGNLG